MAITIRNLENSFVRFDETVTDVCLWPGKQNIPLPVYEQEDVYFQILVETETAAEADELCGLTNDVTVGLVSNCADENYLLEFSEKPARYRVGLLQVLYNWAHGLPGFAGAVQIGDCFRIRIDIDGGITVGCSNQFQRIGSPCFTTVIEFGNEENAFGFLYCADASQLVDAESSTCDPTALSFINQSTLSIPYTQALRDKYGDNPSVQVWHVISGVPQVVTVQIALDGFPPNQILIDNGGPATGWVVIR